MYFMILLRRFKSDVQLSCSFWSVALISYQWRLLSTSFSSNQTRLLDELRIPRVVKNVLVRCMSPITKTNVCQLCCTRGQLFAIKTIHPTCSRKKHSRCLCITSPFRCCLAKMEVVHIRGFKLSLLDCLLKSHSLQILDKSDPTHTVTHRDTPLLSEKMYRNLPRSWPFQLYIYL